MGTEYYFGKSALLRNVSAPRDVHLSPKLYGEGGVPSQIPNRIKVYKAGALFSVKNFGLDKDHAYLL